MVDCMHLKTLLLISILSGADAADLTVETNLGLVSGSLSSENIRIWRGIRYGARPLRWENPIPPTPHGGTYMATFKAPGCIQSCSAPHGIGCPSSTSEDCLFLNVFSPNNEISSGYPVVIWFHGGSFSSGAGTSDWYDGSQFAKNWVVFVSVNYRLGIFGFMASESMTGNYGLMDQRLAMQWTKDNIANFGGNPDSITLMGQSAGAASALYHLTSSNSAKLFHRVVALSSFIGLPSRTRDSATNIAKTMFSHANCVYENIECMRSKSSNELLRVQNQGVPFSYGDIFGTLLTWQPLVETRSEFQDHTYYMLSDGKSYGTTHEMLLGFTKDEGQIFVYGSIDNALHPLLYPAAVALMFGSQASDILYKYPCTFGVISDCRTVLSQLLTDRIFHCPLRYSLKQYTNKYIKNKIYKYNYAHIPEFSSSLDRYTFCVGYSCHGAELPVVFGVYSTSSGSVQVSTNERVLGNYIRAVFTNFIRRGDPTIGKNHPFQFDLSTSSTAYDPVTVIDYPSGYGINNQLRDNYCDFWDVDESYSVNMPKIVPNRYQEHVPHNV